MSEPREFWIDFEIGDDCATSQVVTVDMLERKKYLHVIEYSAYEALKNQRLADVRNDLREEIVKLQQQLTAEKAKSAKLREALKEELPRLKNSIYKLLTTPGEINWPQDVNEWRSFVRLEEALEAEGIIE